MQLDEAIAQMKPTKYFMHNDTNSNEMESC